MDQTKALKLLLDYVKEFAPKDRISLIEKSNIEDAVRMCHPECLKLLLDYIKDCDTQDKVDLIEGAQFIFPSNSKECALDILNFAAKSGITELKGKTLWRHVQENNLETKDTHKLWELTKTWENMDEVHSRLLSNQELGLNFFSDICCFMIKNGKRIDRDIIPEDRKDIVDEIHSVFYQHKYKVFKDVASLEGVAPEDKVKAAISILTMNHPKGEKLLVGLTQNQDSDKFIKHIIASGFLQNGESLAKILPKFGDKIKEVLSNPAQRPGAEKKNLTQSSIECLQGAQGEAAVLEDHEADSPTAASSGENDPSSLVVVENLNPNHNPEMELAGAEG